MMLRNSDFDWALTRALARSAGVGTPRVGWRMHQHPTYNNQVATLSLEPAQASVKVATTVNSHWKDPHPQHGLRAGADEPGTELTRTRARRGLETPVTASIQQGVRAGPTSFSSRR